MATSKKTTSKKTTSKTESQNLNLKLCIVEYVRQHNKLPDWKSPSALDYYLKPLKIAGVLNRKGYGLWVIDWDKWTSYYLKQLQKTRDRKVQKNTKGYNPIRGHGYQFKIKVPKINDWKRRKEILVKSKKAYTPLKGNAYRIIILGCKIWLVEDGLVVYFPRGRSYYGQTANESQAKALYDLRRVLLRLENVLRIRLRSKHGYMFTVDKQHYAEIENDLAKQCNNDKEKIKITGDDGQVWLVMDYSLSSDELEVTHAKRSLGDMQNVLSPFMNDLRNHKARTGETLVVTDLWKAIASLIEDRQHFADNLNSHVKAVQELAKGVNDLRKEQKRIWTRRS